MADGDGAAPVQVLVRRTCGSCARVTGEVRGIAARCGAAVDVIDVDAGDGSLAVEFGDRVPVVLVDDEEVACWEIDEADLLDALAGIGYAER